MILGISFDAIAAIVRACAFTALALFLFGLVARVSFVYYTSSRTGFRAQHWFGITRRGVLLRCERVVADESIGGYAPCGCYHTVALPFASTAAHVVAREKCRDHAPARQARRA